MLSSPTLVGHSKIALTNSFDPLISRNLGSAPGIRDKGPAVLGWICTLMSMWSTSSAGWAERKEDGALYDPQRKFESVKVVKWDHRPYIKNSSAKGRVRVLFPAAAELLGERGAM